MVNTEETILRAAKEVFLTRGYDGARMKEIADKAGINKALLHYYFRSKEKLFLAVFESAMQKLFPSLVKIFSDKGSLNDKIRKFYEIHIGFLIDNPMIPGFIISEMARRRESLQFIVDNFKKLDLYENFRATVEKSISRGEIREVDPAQLMLHIISLSVFPVIAGSLITGIIGISEDDYYKLLDERKKEAAEFVISSIAMK
jgi:AcrR family transcriptional regulator